MNILELDHCHFFAVCDGHGNVGKQISTLIQTNLPGYIENCMLENFGGKDHLS